MNFIKWQALTYVCVLMISCNSSKTNKDADNPDNTLISPTQTTQVQPADAGIFDHDKEPPPPPPEGRKVHAYIDGQGEEIFESEAIDKGLTLIDLSNYWVPFIFSEQDSPQDVRLPNKFRATYRKLSNDWFYESRTMSAARQIVEKRISRAHATKRQALRDQGVAEHQIKERLGIKEEKKPLQADAGTNDLTDSGMAIDLQMLESGAGNEEHYLEVYGIHPSLSVLRKRALTELNRSCLQEIDYERIKRFGGFIAYKSNKHAKASAKKGKFFAKKMRTEMENLGVEDPYLLVANPQSKSSKGLVSIAIRYEAMAEAQKLLVCENMFAPGSEKNYRKGALDWKTHQALTTFERKNRIFAWGFFGKETLLALGKTPKQRLFDAFMRVLVERIIDATKIIEDGSARDSQGNKPKYTDKNGQEHEVPNLVAQYSALILKNMNLNTPDKMVNFLTSFDDSQLDQLFVAIPLPQRPDYYSDEMTLHSVINRGDVWYDYPYTIEGKQKGQPRKRMPTNTLYVKWNDQDIPLFTTNTTIGSWRTEFASDGYEYYKYKNSDVGQKVWKDIVAGPVWLPPDTTVPKDLLKTVVYKGRAIKVPNYDEFGPWYASAYGLVAAFHVRQVANKKGEFRYLDNGIRSHGSVDYNSILRRFSHGCHRLYNHMAIRLFNFVLRHKLYTRVGQTSAGYSKKIEVDEDIFFLTLNSRGYKYELKNPVPVMVERGRVRGKQRTPIEHYMPKPNYEYGDDAQFLPEEYKQAQQETTDAGVSSQTDTQIKSE